MGETILDRILRKLKIDDYMTKYLVKRFKYTLKMLVALSFVIFLIMRLPPGDYVSNIAALREMQGQAMNEADKSQLVRILGLDQPIFSQYLMWIGRVIGGDFGYSHLEGQSVSAVVSRSFRFSILIGGITFVTTTVFGHFLGYQAARRKNTWVDYIASTLGVIGASVPPFVLALLILLALFRLTGKAWVGPYSREFALVEMSLAKVIDMAKHFMIPVFVITISNMGFKGIRANMLDEINKPYVVTARAKGMRELHLNMKYPFRMALLPSVGNVATLLPALISGDAIISSILNFPTLGPLLLTALKQQDMYLAGAILLLQCVIVLVGAFAADLVLAALDPRVRLVNNVEE